MQARNQAAAGDRLLEVALGKAKPEIHRQASTVYMYDKLAFDVAAQQQKHTRYCATKRYLLTLFEYIVWKTVPYQVHDTIHTHQSGATPKTHSRPTIAGVDRPGLSLESLRGDKRVDTFYKAEGAKVAGVMDVASSELRVNTRAK